MTRASQFTDFADAIESAARTDRELQINVDSIPLGRTAYVPDPTNLRVWGSGNKTVIRPTVAMRNRDWLRLGDGRGSENILLDGFLFQPPSGMTGGWAIRMDKCGRTHLNNIDVGGNSGATPHMAQGGFWFHGYDKCEITHCNIYAHHKGMLVNGMPDQSWGADFTMDSDTKIQNHRQPNMSDAKPGAVGVHLAGGQGGTYLGGNIIYCGIGVLIDTAMTGLGVINREVFFQPGCIIDSCEYDGIRVMEQSVGTLQWTGAWSASHGRRGSGCGLRVQPNQQPTAVTHITGGRVFNNAEDGVAVNGGMLFISGLLANANKGYGLHVPNDSVRGAVDSLFAAINPNGKGPVRNTSAGFKVGSIW